MAPWVRKLFVDVLPKYLFIQRPDQSDDDDDDLCMMHNTSSTPLSLEDKPHPNHHQSRPCQPSQHLHHQHEEEPIYHQHEETNGSELQVFPPPAHFERACGYSPSLFGQHEMDQRTLTLQSR